MCATDPDGELGNTSKHDSDVVLLMDEAKTMLSVGAYHENIVNLQGITYEADYEQEHITKVGIDGFNCVFN